MKAKVDVKSKAPNGVSFNVKGTSPHEGTTSGSVRVQNSASPNEILDLLTSPWTDRSQIRRFCQRYFLQTFTFHDVHQISQRQ